MNDDEGNLYGRLSTSDSRIPLVVGQYRQEGVVSARSGAAGTGAGEISSPIEAHVQSRYPVQTIGQGEAGQRVDTVERFR